MRPGPPAGYDYKKNSYENYYLLDVSKEITVVNSSRREEVPSVTFNVLDEEAAPVSCDDVISVYHWLDQVLIRCK